MGLGACLVSFSLAMNVVEERLKSEEDLDLKDELRALDVLVRHLVWLRLHGELEERKRQLEGLLNDKGRNGDGKATKL